GLWCGIKGAAKGLWNGIKGCVTNSEGKFSLGKTLLTIGAAAACIAFPAVGVVACGIGLVSGGVNVAKGVINASKATTDAAKKDALEQIGDGTFTVVSSAVGMKASINAVKATSTVAKASQVDDLTNAVKGLDNVDDITNALKGLDKLDNVDDVAQALSKLDDVDDIARVISEQGKFKDVSKLGNLAEDATKLEKLGALGQDMWSSTKNNGANVLKLATDTKNALELKKLDAAKSRLEGKEGLTEAQNKRLTTVKEQLATKTAEASEGTTAQLERINKVTSYFKEGRASVKEARDSLSDAQKALASLKKAKASEEEIAKAQKSVTELQAALKTTKNTTGLKGIVNNVTSKSETVQFLSQTKKTLTQDGITKLVTNFKANKDAIKASSFFASLTNDGKAIVTLLTEEGYASAVHQYGRTNVLSVLESFWGLRVADGAI
ncbi:hypothetical protein IJ531_05420, partial [bacterium]|nr:hypothetical protein [bacterium]